MNPKSILAYLWKLPACGLAFFAGMIASGAALPALGFQAPELPAGTDASTIAAWFLGGSLLLALALSFISPNLGARWPLRASILSIMTWAAAALAMILESFFFIDTGAVATLSDTLFTALNFLLPSLFLGTAAALLFRPAAVDGKRGAWRNYFSARHAAGWARRLLGALVAYPLVYFTFGLLVEPFIRSYYAQGLYELAAPTWGQLIPLQLARSALLLIVCLPVAVYWRSSRVALWLRLGFALFVMTAFMAVISAYWFPWQMRLFHGLELLADALVYAGALALLLGRQDNAASGGIPNHAIARMPQTSAH